MATANLVRGKTLPDTGVKNDLHELIDLSTVSISDIVNADISNSAAIAGSKISPNFGAQAVVGGTGTFSDDISGSGDFSISGTGAFGGLLTLEGGLTVDGAVTLFGADVDLGTSAVSATQATTDGIVKGLITYDGGSANQNWKAQIYGYTDSNANPTTLKAQASIGSRAEASDAGATIVNDFSMKVKKGDYYKTTETDSGSVANVQFYFTPLG